MELLGYLAILFFIALILLFTAAFLSTCLIQLVIYFSRKKEKKQFFSKNFWLLFWVLLVCNLSVVIYFIAEFAKDYTPIHC